MSYSNNQLSTDLQNEDTMLPIIQQYFNDPTIVKLVSKYASFDFRGSDTLYELKTRHCMKNTYKTTIFPTKKFNFEPKTKKILIFSFEDGNYYIEYNEAFDLFKREDKRFRYIVGKKDCVVEYVYIPVECLIPLTG